MDVLIDDFTSGHVLAKEITPANRLDQISPPGKMLGGKRRVMCSVVNDPTKHRNQPVRLELGTEGTSDGLNLTAPAASSGGLELHYGDGTGATIREDWRSASLLQMKLRAYTSFLGVTFAVALFSPGARSSFSGVIRAKGNVSQDVDLPFAQLVPVGEGVDLASIIRVQFVFTWNDGFCMTSLRVI